MFKIADHLFHLKDSISNTIATKTSAHDISVWALHKMYTFEMKILWKVHFNYIVKISHLTVLEIVLYRCT